MSDFEPVVPHLADFSPVEPLDGFPPQPVTPPIIEVARLNGTQYWQLSEAIQFVGNYRVEIDVSFDSSKETDLKVMDSTTGDSKRFDININNYTNPLPYINRRPYMELLVNGIDTNTIPDDDSEFTLTIYRDSETVDRGQKEVFYLGARYSVENFLFGYVKNLRIYDENNTLTHEIPLTNRLQGATQLPNVGNVSATMVNYSEDVWEEI